MVRTKFKSRGRDENELPAEQVERQWIFGDFGRPKKISDGRKKRRKKRERKRKEKKRKKEERGRDVHFILYQRECRNFLFNDGIIRGLHRGD